VSAEISITVDGKKVSVAPDQRPTHLFAEAKEIVVCKVNGLLKDLWSELHDGDVVESVAISSPLNCPRISSSSSADFSGDNTGHWSTNHRWLLLRLRS
jgi:hypothetical protein